jgi:RNA-binding protein YlmH
MGSILGLGIKRSKIGDIHVLADGCHAVVADDISAFLHLNLSQVHRVHVMTDLLPLDKLKVARTNFEAMDITVSSMRLDGIASDAYRISRTKIVVPIKAGRCRVNWKVEEDPSANLKEGDVVSIQGFGRFKVLETGGLTKKGRYRIKVGKYA